MRLPEREYRVELHLKISIDVPGRSIPHAKASARRLIERLLGTDGYKIYVTAVIAGDTETVDSSERREARELEAVGPRGAEADE